MLVGSRCLFRRCSFAGALFTGALFAGALPVAALPRRPPLTSSSRWVSLAAVSLPQCSLSPEHRLSPQRRLSPQHPGQQHLPDGAPPRRPCQQYLCHCGAPGQQQTSFVGEKYSGLASNLAHLDRIC